LCQGQQQWIRRRHITKERPNCRQPGIASAGSIATPSLQVIQEHQHPWRVQIVHAHNIGFDVIAALQESEQQPECIAVAPNRSRA
jgi:1-deoxy-D-xylulose 5-phosphate reductoisomerase